MRLERLALADFRNYAELEIEPHAGLNVFIGANAQGKSNLLEAIAMLAIGKSFRTSHDAQAIRLGSDRAIVRGDVARFDERIELGCTISSSENGVRKRFTRAGRGVAYAQFLGTLRAVTFAPSDLQLVTGAPSLRRAFLNATLSQQQPPYYHALSRYQSALRQKNAVLRHPEPDEELLAVYDRTLAESGAVLMRARGDFIEALARKAGEAHASWSGKERLELRYVPNVAATKREDGVLREAIATRLGQVRHLERVRRMALAGPHRDDMAFFLDERPLAAFGSQGQQRTAVLALKAGEYAVMRESSGEAPILLLDDLLSELDEQRAEAFLSDVGAYEQAYLTATHRPPRLPKSSSLFTVAAAFVTPC